MAELVNDPEQQQALANAIKAHPELLFKAAEHAVGKPRQTLEVASSDKFTWTPPARADGPISVPSHVLVFPQGAHIHGADFDDREGELHCIICHENWAARLEEDIECPRCREHPEERPDRRNG